MAAAPAPGDGATNAPAAFSYGSERQTDLRREAVLDVADGAFAAQDVDRNALVSAAEHGAAGPVDERPGAEAGIAAMWRWWRSDGW